MEFVKSISKVRTILLAGVCLLLFSWMAPMSGYALNFVRYVDVGLGNDGATPQGLAHGIDAWKTLHYAIDAINSLLDSEGDTCILHVASGVYTFNDGSEPNSPIIIQKDSLTIDGADSTKPIIDGSTATSWRDGLQIGDETYSPSNVVIKDLVLRNFLSDRSGIRIENGSNNAIESCEIHSNQYGVHILSTGNGNQVRNGCSIHDNSKGIYIDGSSPEISSNTIYDNEFNIAVTADSLQTASPTIKDNLIYDGLGEVTAVSYGIIIGGSGTVSPKIYHNTIAGGLYNGIYMDGSGQTPDIKYNIITGFGQFGIENLGGAGHPVIDYNDVWGNAHGTYDNCVDPPPGENNISYDPEYVSQGSWDFTLLGSSPCINAIPIGDPPNDPVDIDIVGIARPYGLGYDMGCYESNTFPVVTTTDVTAVTTSTATSGGNVTSNGGSPLSARGVCWSTSANPTTSDSCTDNGTATGVFTSSITGLSSDTIYHVRAYATNGSGTGYGSDKTFGAPTVSTTGASAITASTATSGGNVTSEGGPSVTVKGVCWSTSANPTTSDSCTDNGTGSGSFTSSISGLSSDTIYHVRAYATNSNGTSYGIDKSFTTAVLTRYVDITAGTDDTSHGASSGSGAWETIHYSFEQINGGINGNYILYVAAGDYRVVDNGGKELDAMAHLSQSNVTIFGADRTNTKIIGAGALYWTEGIKITGSNNVMKNLSVTGFSDTNEEGIRISGGTENEIDNCMIFNNQRGIEIISSSAFKIRGCEIYSNTNDGLYVESSTDGEIYRNTIYRHQGTGNDGVAVLNCSPAIKRNKIYDNDAGISVEANGGATVSSPDIANNVIYETTDYFMAYGILVKGDNGGEASPTIYHNSIDGGTGDGIAIKMVSTSTLVPLIKYNIITHCDAYGIDAGGVNVPLANIAYNDVWGNTSENYHNCAAGTGGISANPLQTSQAGELASDSPCLDAIPTDSGDPVNMDYPGYSRPKGDGFDMGAYEYIPIKTANYILPGGEGAVTDYSIFTIPLDIGTGANMRDTMKEPLGGTYDPTHWRVFARIPSGDVEMNTQAFASLDIKPGMGFWGITLYTNTITFQGKLAPDAIYYKIKLAPGWNLFAVPWPTTNINLGNIYVTDGVNQYAITDESNTLTDKYVWDYTGTTGYIVRSASDFSLKAGTGYFIKVPGSSNIILSIPPDNNSTPPDNYSASSSPAISHRSPESVRLPNDPEPPPLPDGSYGPVPDIKANGKSGPVTVSNGAPLSITVSLDPGNRPVKKADWWITAHTSFDPPLDWYSYVFPNGWQPGIHAFVQISPFQIPPSLEVLNAALPDGNYNFYFAVDDNADGIPDATWLDSVEVRVE